MNVRNRQKDAIPATITVEQLGKAMAQLDLSNIPEHKRYEAIMEHLGRIASETAARPSDRQKLMTARLLRAKLASNEPFKD